MINFAPFYKDIDPDTGIDHKKLKRRIGKINYREKLNLLYESFIMFNQHNKFIVQTDETTILPYTCNRSNLNNLNLMESIIVANLDFVKNNVGKSVMVGADNIVLNKIDNFFDEEFDLGIFCLEERDPNEKYNVTNGVILVNSNLENQNKIVDFFIQRHEIYKTFDYKYKTWWGDMLSLNVLLSQKEIVSKFYESKKTKKIHDFNGLKIKLFEVNKKYYKFVNSDGYYNKNKNDILLDFPGDALIKRHAKTIFENIRKK